MNMPNISAPKHWYSSLCIFSFVICSGLAQAKPVAKFLDYSPYHSELIKRALDVAEPTYGNIALAPVNRYLPSLRVLKEVQRDEDLNMFWGPAIKDLAKEDIFNIPIPLVKGLSGFRIMLIRKNEQEKFNGISTSKTLKKFSIGQGFGWIENNIYADNGIKVLEATDFQALFIMLSKGRFDALPVGADMVNNHFHASQEHVNNLAIEETLIIYYPMPVFLYVSKKQPLLAEILQYGLTRLIESGEMDAIFYKHFGSLIKQLNLDSRKMFVIENNYLMPGVPLQNKEMWFRGETLVQKYSQ